MSYPTAEAVEAADHEQLCRWHRFLKSPGERAIGQDDFNDVLNNEAKIQDLIQLRLKAAGGFTPEISKRIGWGN